MVSVSPPMETAFLIASSNEEDSRKAVELNMKDVSKKETKYNTTWKKVWDK